MFLFIVLVLSLLLFVLCVWKEQGGGAFAAFTISVILFTGSAFSYIGHYHDVGTIKAGYYTVEVYERRKVTLVELINDLAPVASQNNLVLANKDAPYSALFNELSQVTKDIARAEHNIAACQISIAQRKVGMFSFIVTFMGEK